MAQCSERQWVGASGDTTIAYYLANDLSAQDYYPFGMIMPGRQYTSIAYRYGFNVTTEVAWKRHLTKYTSTFGEGIGIHY